VRLFVWHFWGKTTFLVRRLHDCRKADVIATTVDELESAHRGEISLDLAGIPLR
jgi:hypothetical protein